LESAVFKKQKTIYDGSLGNIDWRFEMKKIGMRWIILLFLIPIFVISVLILHPILLIYSTSRFHTAQLIAPFIEDIYDYYQREGVWPNKNETDEILNSLRATLKNDGLRLSLVHDSIAPSQIIVSLKGKRYIYYYFTTCENINSNDRIGWHYVYDGTYYPLQKSDWPEIQLPTFPCP